MSPLLIPLHLLLDEKSLPLSSTDALRVLVETFRPLQPVSCRPMSHHILYWCGCPSVSNEHPPPVPYVELLNDIRITLSYINTGFSFSYRGIAGIHPILTTGYFYVYLADMCQGSKKVRDPGFAESKVWDLDGSWTLCCHFCRKTLETQDPKIWILREAQGT